LAGWIIKFLLEDGWTVRGTVRDSTQKDKFKHLLHEHFEVVDADLLKPETWANAVAGCSYVCHTASPFPLEVPKDEQVLIKPAVEGTLAVLKAAAAEDSVKRVILTSSVAAVRSGHDSAAKNKDKVFTEEDWSIVEKCEPYSKSKTLAEKAAWDFIASLPKERNLELIAINPTYIVGPLLSPTGGESSRKLVERLMKNDMPGVPALWLDVVDVRDVARAHIAAISSQVPAGNRFLCTSAGCWMMDISNMLSKEFSKFGYKLPSMPAPKPLIWIVSFWDKDAAALLSSIGVSVRIDNSKAKNYLGIQFQEISTSFIDMANSLIDFGFIPDLRKKQ